MAIFPGTVGHVLEGDFATPGSIVKSLVAGHKAEGSALACLNPSSDAWEGPGQATATRLIWKWGEAPAPAI